MTRFPACFAAPLRINTFPLRAAAAVWQSQLPRRLLTRAQVLLTVTTKLRVVVVVQLLTGLQAMA